MMFIKTAIDEIIEDSESKWTDYFDKEGNVQGVSNGSSKPSLPSYQDYYHALGYFFGKDIQDKYRRKVRFCTGLLALQRSSVLLSMLILTVGLILAMFGQKPDDFPSIAVFLIACPWLGYLIYSIFIESWLTTYLGNAYRAEKSKSSSAVVLKAPKGRKHWPLLILSLLFLATGFLQSWTEAFTFIIFFSSTLVISCVEGFLLRLLAKILFVFLPKKKEATVRRSLSPQLIWQIKQKFEGIYKDFQEGDYAAAYAKFDSSRFSEEEFQQEIQDFLTENGQKCFYLPDFREVEHTISFSKITDRECKAVLSFLGSMEEDTLFRLDCHVTFEEDKLQSLELIELSR